MFQDHSKWPRKREICNNFSRREYKSPQKKRTILPRLHLTKDYYGIVYLVCIFLFWVKNGPDFFTSSSFFYVCYDSFVSSNSAIAVYCATKLSQSWWWFHAKCVGPSNLKLIDCLQFEMHRFLITENEKLIKQVNFERIFFFSIFERNFERDSEEKNAMEFHIEQNNNDEEYWGKKLVENVWEN